MSIDVVCESCGFKMRVEDRMAGRKGRCKGCGTEVRVPDASAQAPATRLSVPTGPRSASSPRSAPPIPGKPRSANVPTPGQRPSRPPPSDDDLLDVERKGRPYKEKQTPTLPGKSDPIGPQGPLPTLPGQSFFSFGRDGKTPYAYQDRTKISAFGFPIPPRAILITTLCLSFLGYVIPLFVLLQSNVTINYALIWYGIRLLALVPTTALAVFVTASIMKFPLPRFTLLGAAAAMAVPLFLVPTDLRLAQPLWIFVSFSIFLLCTVFIFNLNWLQGAIATLASTLGLAIVLTLLFTAVTSVGASFPSPTPPPDNSTLVIANAGALHTSTITHPNLNHSNPSQNPDPNASTTTPVDQTLPPPPPVDLTPPGTPSQRHAKNTERLTGLGGDILDFSADKKSLPASLADLVPAYAKSDDLASAFSGQPYSYVFYPAPPSDTDVIVFDKADLQVIYAGGKVDNVDAAELDSLLKDAQASRKAIIK